CGTRSIRVSAEKADYNPLKKLRQSHFDHITLFALPLFTLAFLSKPTFPGCCHVKFLWPERPGARRYSGETGRNFPCIESFEAMVANCVCGSATRWNRETIAGR